MTDISIIIPTVNRASLLPRALTSVAAMVSSDDPVEIIIVDNGSTDETARVCRDIAEKFPKHDWRYFFDNMPGLLTGRHRGAREARGEILAYLDDDVLLAPSWLKSLRDAFRDPGVVLVGGPSTPHYEIEPPSWLEGFWTDYEGGRRCGALSLIECGNAIRPADPLYIWGLNFAIRAKTFKECGGFHPDCIPKALQRYQGDGETGLAFKIKDKRLPCLYHPGVSLKHVIPASRLTPASIEQRGFYQGVCDSFSKIRHQRSVDDGRSESWKNIVRPLKRRLHRAHLIRQGTATSIRQLMERAHAAGFAFHQNEVRNDPKLLEWVLRPDYFDYALPDGWQRYLKAPPQKTALGAKSNWRS